jgi:hypothetical protein
MRTVSRTHKSRFVLLLVAAVIVLSLLQWAAFHRQSFAVFSGNPIVISFILMLGIAPIYPLYLQLRKRSGLHAVFTVLVIAVQISAVVYIIASWIFHIDSLWVSLVSKLTTALILAAGALGICKALVKRKSTDN